METNSERVMALESALREAFAKREMVLFYQPKVRLSNSELMGFEALIRWQRPGKGLFTPADFLPLLGEIVMVSTLNDYVQEAACAQLAAWQQAGLTPVPVSVNLTVETLCDPTLISDFTERCARHGISPALLEIEVTETSLLEESATVQHNLRGLRELGVRIFIDDFGTGYSALSYLQRFEMDCIKIDRSFVNLLGGRQDDSPMIRAIAMIGHHLGMTVIAEGVETEAQRHALEALGCEFAQGYYFGKPMPADDATAYLARGGDAPPGAAS
jgi:EAL domain-containing protein (putative c-di-GMP-specific phosphodiesterase class I)